MSARRESHRDVVERIANDPVVQARVSAELAKNPAVAEGKRIYAEAAQELLAELRPLVPQFAEMGHQLSRVGELVELAVFIRDEQGEIIRRQKVDYRAAIPLLVSWLPRASYPPLAFDLVHVLSMAKAKKHARPVFMAVLRDPQELHDPRYPGEEANWRRLLRGYLAIGLVTFADAAAADDLLELVRTPELGEARNLLVCQALPKTKDPRVPGVLLELLDDPDLARWAVAGLGKLKYAPARSRLESMLDCPDSTMRQEVKQALKELA